MHLTSKKFYSIILAVTAITCARTALLLINDPEGPNLVVVLGLGAVVYGISFAISALLPSVNPINLKRLLLIVLIQVVVATCLYFVMV